MSQKQLYKHQVEAVQKVVDSGFESGIIHYATGSGKSLIGQTIAVEFNKQYPDQNILWICEHKFIINQQFTLTKSFPLVVTNYAKRGVLNSGLNWADSVNSSVRFWRKTQLIAINRTFMTQNDNYTKLKIPIGLIIHDECHTASNKTSQAFYKWLHERYPNIKCVGLSATPTLSWPYNRIIAKFDMIDAIRNDIICSPEILFLNSRKPTINDVFNIILKHMKDSVSAKIIVWCGTIDNCEIIKAQWIQQPTVSSIAVYSSHSCAIDETDAFNAADSNAILFCANKHREASDFHHLDGCVFLDGVSERSEKLFMQCMGRVLRKYEGKTKGWIFDAHASNCMELVNRMLHFVDTPKTEWQIVTETKGSLTRITVDTNTRSISIPANNLRDIFTPLASMFVRDVPYGQVYRDRLKMELDMIYDKRVYKYIEYACIINRNCGETIHITRGSCGSSLVCYLLGITHVDPVKYGIKFERFLHHSRQTLPDIDFDFPYNVRNDVFMKIHNIWGDRVSRISCKINWQERSALREAIRRVSDNPVSIRNTELATYIKSLSPDKLQKISQIQSELLNTPRTTMKHVGGIVFDYYQHRDANSRELLAVTLDDKKTAGGFKVDILSSRSLAVLYECDPQVDITEFEPDEAVFRVFADGDNLGLILAESVLMRRAFMRYKPRTIEDIAKCLAIVRPMAKNARERTLISDMPEIVYDDDVLDYIAEVMNTDMAGADNIRRAVSKGDEYVIESLLRASMRHAKYRHASKAQHIKLVERLTEYGFCKSHSVSYAMMIWHMARCKAANPAKYWSACLEHADSTYLPWVYYTESMNAGVDLSKCHKYRSVFSQIRERTNIEKMATLTERQQLLQYGYWNNIYLGVFYDGCYYDRNTGEFVGIVGAIRTTRAMKTKNQCGLFIGVSIGKYLDMVLEGVSFFDNKLYVGVKGVCRVKSAEENTFVSNSYQFI